MTRPYLAARAEENSAESQVVENMKKKPQRISLTENSQKGYSSPVPKSTNLNSVPLKVAFIPSEEEKKIIRAIQLKTGVKKATEVLRMALKQLGQDVKAAG